MWQTKLAACQFSGVYNALSYNNNTSNKAKYTNGMQKQQQINKQINKNVIYNSA